MLQKRRQRRVGATTSGQHEFRHYRNVGIVCIVIGLVVALLIAAVLLVSGTDASGLLLAAWSLLALDITFGILIAYILLTLEPMLLQARDQAVVIAMRTQATTPAAPPASTQIEYGQTSRDVEIIQGIGSVFSHRLARSGIRTLEDLRTSPEIRIAQAAKVPDAQARRWKLMANLMVVRELDAQAAELLVNAGIESLDDLAAQEPGQLLRLARATNASHQSRIYPSEITLAAVDAWVDAARRRRVA